MSRPEAARARIELPPSPVVGGEPFLLIEVVVPFARQSVHEANESGDDAALDFGEGLEVLLLRSERVQGEGSAERAGVSGSKGSDHGGSEVITEADDIKEAEAASTAGTAPIHIVNEVLPRANRVRAAGGEAFVLRPVAVDDDCFTPGDASAAVNACESGADEGFEVNLFPAKSV